MAMVIGMSFIANLTTHTNPQLSQLVYSAFSLAGVGATVYAIHADIMKRKISK
jgi:hypothetical protein